MSIRERYKALFKNRRFAVSCAVSVVLVIVALVVSGLAQMYAGRAATNAVGDFFLDNLPIFPWPALLHDILLWGSLLFVAAVFAYTAINPEYWPLALKAASSMYIVRAFFISLTHLKGYSTAISVVASYHFTARLADMIYSNEAFFFSSHTALPFMLALVFWNKKQLRRLLLGATMFFGATVLVAKAHYSIDVFAAPLIGYSVFAAIRKIFPFDFLWVAKENSIG